MRFSIALHPHLVMSALWILTILIGVCKNILVVLICVFLHLFTCVFSIRTVSLMRCLFRSCIHFSTELFVSLLLSFKSILYIFNTNTLSGMCLKIFFLLTCGFSLHSFNSVSQRQKKIILIMSNFIFLFYKLFYQCCI